jgi:hypothetical protein
MSQFGQFPSHPGSTYPHATRMPESPTQEEGNPEVRCRYCRETADVSGDRPADRAVCKDCLAAQRAEAVGWLMELKQDE